MEQMRAQMAQLELDKQIALRAQQDALRGPEVRAEHIQEVEGLVVDSEGWPVIPPGLERPSTSGGQPAQQASAQFSAQAQSQAHSPSQDFASDFTHSTTSQSLFCGSTTKVPVSANLFSESKGENFLVPLHEQKSSIDDMVRTHISMNSRDGGQMSDGRISFSEGHFGKGVSRFSGGHMGKGQITSTSQLGTILHKQPRTTKFGCSREKQRRRGR